VCLHAVETVVLVVGNVHNVVVFAAHNDIAAAAAIQSEVVVVLRG